jgi:hypothetical protein
MAHARGLLSRRPANGKGYGLAVLDDGRCT